MAFPFVKFNNGQHFPIIGLGISLGRKNSAIEAVKHAIDVGYRHIDTAFIYLNEKEVGVAIQEKIKGGVIKREDIYITSKLWNTYHRKDLVLPALKRSLKTLGLKYLDLYLIHWPTAFKEGDELFPADENKKLLFSDVKYTEPWKVMEQCVKDGLIKSIGVSNFTSQQIEVLLNEAEIKPVTNQIECHPYLTQKKLRKFCHSKGIAVTAYSPLGSPGRPQARKGGTILIEDPLLKEIAKRYKKTVAQILIRYQIDLGHIVIPKSVTKERIESNIVVFDFKLSTDDLKLIDTLNKNVRYITMEEGKDHEEYPFKTDY